LIKNYLSLELKLQAIFLGEASERGKIENLQAMILLTERIFLKLVDFSLLLRQATDEYETRKRL